jgi:hypothetical protein
MTILHSRVLLHRLKSECRGRFVAIGQEAKSIPRSTRQRSNQMQSCPLNQL